MPLSLAILFAVHAFLLAVTPDDFQGLALGWITTLTAVVVAIGFAAAKIWPVVIDLRARFEALNDRVDRHGDRLTSQDATIASVALATPPPAATPTPTPAVPASSAAN